MSLISSAISRACFSFIPIFFAIDDNYVPFLAVTLESLINNSSKGYYYAIKVLNTNIEERNKRILEGNGGSDFYLDEGLMKKLESKWEKPTEEEYDVIYIVDRKNV